MITAGIGDYRSRPVRAVGDAYAGLVVEPEYHQLLGEPIEFYLDDTRSETVHVFKGGVQYEGFDLAFGKPTSVGQSFQVGSVTATAVPLVTPTSTRTATIRTQLTPTQSPTPSPTPALKVGLGVSITTEPSGRESEGQQSASAASTPTEEISTATAKELAEAI